MRTHLTVKELFNQLFSEAKPSVKLLLLIILAGTSYLIITFIGLLLAVPLFSTTWEQLQTSISEGFQDSGTGLIYYLQGIQTLGLFVVPALLANFLLFKQGSGFLSGNHSKIHIAWVLSLIMLILSAPFIQWVIDWNAQIRFPEAMKTIENALQTMEEERTKITERLLTGESIRIFFFNILIISVLPALGEEFIFRGVLQRILGEWFKNAHLSIMITALLFSMFHLQFYGILPRLVLGIYFGYLYFWSGTIWLPVLAHFFNNAMAVSISFLTSASTMQLPGFLTGDSTTSLPLLLISSFITCVLIIIIRRELLVR